MYLKCILPILIGILTVCPAKQVLSMGSKPPLKQQAWEQMPLRSQAQKESGFMGGEGMQMIFGIAYAPSNPETVYMVSDTSQVWKSVDGGTSWLMKHRGFMSNGGVGVSVDPLNDDIAFVAGSYAESYGRRYSPADGIYRTTDGGEVWELVKPTSFFRGHEGKHFVFDSGNSDKSRTEVIYAGTHNDGLLITRDGGNNWKTLGFKGDRILDMELEHNNASVLYLLTVRGFFRIKINDYKVVRIDTLGKDLTGRIKTFSMNPKNPLIIYAVLGKGGVFKSADGGISFKKIDNGLPEKLDYTQIEISPVNPEYLLLSVQRWDGLNPFWSHDGGNSWHQPQTLDRNNDSLTKGRFFTAPVSFHPFDAGTALTSANGADRILKTVDGGRTWFYSSNGYTGGRRGGGISSQGFYSDPYSMILFLMDFGAALTVDGGETFRLLPIPKINHKRTTRAGAVSPFDKNIIVTAAGSWAKQTIVVSRDNGNSWKVFPGTEDKYMFIGFHQKKSDIIYGQGFISEDNGISWSRLSQRIRAVFRGNNDIVYALNTYGKNQSIIKRSNDRGKTWLTPYPYLPLRPKEVNEIVIDPLNPDRIYAATNNGFYIYDNNKGKWLSKDKKSGLSKDVFGSMSFKCVAVDPKKPAVIYTGRWSPGKGHSNGIFRSVTYGKTWENITYNLGPEFTAWSLSVSPHDGTVYMGSSHGTWKLSPPY